MDPVSALAAAELKRRIARLVARVATVVLPVVAIGFLGVTVFASSLFATEDATGSTVGLVSCGSVSHPPSGQIASLDAEQLANAQTIVAVGRRLGVPQQGWIVAISAALQESGLRTLPYGDRDSIGMFQQRKGWGSRTDRLDPVTSTEMFFAGGHGGQRGLLGVPEYLTMPVTEAAQAVQASAFPDAYAKWESTARQVVSAPAVFGSACSSTAGPQSASRVIEVAMSQLGVPYSWGGGTLSGPSPGFGSGAGVSGFDCSSFTRYVYFHAIGVTLPRVASDQAAAVAHVAASQARAGDLVFFHDPRDPAGFFHHVGIYDGEGHLIHAPTAGRTVEVSRIDLSAGRVWADDIVLGRPPAGP